MVSVMKMLPLESILFRTMMKKKIELPELEWNVMLYSDIDGCGKMVAFNIFNSHRFHMDIEELFQQKEMLDETTFSRRVESAAMYTFWSRYEYEIAVGPLFKIDEKICAKVDVYEQLKLNWPHLIRYLYNVYYETKIKEYLL